VEFPDQQHGNTPRSSAKRPFLFLRDLGEEAQEKVPAGLKPRKTIPFSSAPFEGAPQLHSPSMPAYRSRCRSARLWRGQWTTSAWTFGAIFPSVPPRWTTRAAPVHYSHRRLPRGQWANGQARVQMDSPQFPFGRSRRVRPQAGAPAADRPPVAVPGAQSQWAASVAQHRVKPAPRRVIGPCTCRCSAPRGYDRRSGSALRQIKLENGDIQPAGSFIRQVARSKAFPWALLVGPVHHQAH